MPCSSSVARKAGRSAGSRRAGCSAWVGRDRSLACASDAITEQPVKISPSATAREALTALSQPGTSHLLVCRREDATPEGVVSELDLVALEGA